MLRRDWRGILLKCLYTVPWQWLLGLRRRSCGRLKSVPTDAQCGKRQVAVVGLFKIYQRFVRKQEYSVYYILLGPEDILQM